MLVDFENDSVRTSLEVARALGPQLWGVRLDTSSQLVDRSLWERMGGFDPRGVNESLVRNVREALDADGFERVKIVVSGGFDVERISAFERAGVPVDSYERRLGAHSRKLRLHGRHRAYGGKAGREGRTTGTTGISGSSP